MIASASSSLSNLARGWLGAVLPHAGMFAANRLLLQRNRGKAGDDILDAAQVTKLLGLRYRVLRHVGSGAVGQVWLVRDKRTLCHRVVKFCCNSNQIQELSGVGSSLSLRHHGLIDVLGYEKSEDAAFIWYFMPPADDLGGFPDVLPRTYIPCTLEKYMDWKKALSPSDCVAIGLELGAVLDYLHGNGFVHQDIKPANIVRVGGRWKLADIGLMARIGCFRQVGTRGYVPPEGHGRRSGDIYSLGMVLSQMLNGGLRLERAKLEAVMMAAEGVRMRLLQVALKATAEASHDRYRSAKALSKELRKIRRQLER